VLNSTANSCNNCTIPSHTGLAREWIPTHWSRQVRFEWESWKFLRAGGANSILSCPHDSWNRTQSRQGFAGNKINVTVVVSFSLCAREYSICMNLQFLITIHKWWQCKQTLF